MKKCICALLLGVLLCGTLFSCGNNSPATEPTSEGLEYAMLPDGTSAVTGMGTCEDLTVRIPDSSPNGTVVTKIAGYAFQEQNKLEGVTIPRTVTEIGPYAFAGCESLKDITLPDALVEIGMYAFSRCVAMTNIYLGSSLRVIGDGAFNACRELQYAFWRGNATSWGRVTIGTGNSALTIAGTLFYYSATTPTTSGYYWYYDGGIRLWS